MAIRTTGQPSREFTFPPSRGSYAQRIRDSYRRPQGAPGWIRPGRGLIQGYIKIGSVGATQCRAVLLSEGSAVPLDDAEIINGAYLFRFLAPGRYAVVVVDTTGTWRAKVIHTVVPPAVPA